MDRTLTLYHGSSLILKRPQFGKGNPFHDYGLGFYCTETLEVAKEWACSMAQDGFVNRYSFRTGGLSILNLADGNYTILNWLSILLMNRKFNLSSDIAAQGKAYLVSTFLPPYEDYDVIIGKQREPWAIGTGKQTSTSHRNDGFWMSFSVFCYSFSRFYVVLFPFLCGTLCCCRR